MTSFVALLRGINVGGHKLIKMGDLKQMFEALGVGQVQTYIQSGNVVFKSTESAAELRPRIEGRIEAVFGFHVPVVLRTIAELERIIAECPFSWSAVPEGGNLYVSLLAETPTQKGIDRLLASRSESDDYHLAHNRVYVLCRQSSRESNFSNNLLEKKLGVAVTTRNWQTMNTLLELGRSTGSANRPYQKD